MIAKLHAVEGGAQLSIVGGAAIALAYWSERGATVDIDAELGPVDVVLDAAEETASEHGWPQDWLNDSASIFIPTGYGRAPEWVTVYARDGVVVRVASAEMLLAMKLNAALRRGRREIRDLAVLTRICGVSTVDAAEDLFGEFYPGEEFNQTAVATVEAAFTFDVGAVTVESIDLD